MDRKLQETFKVRSMSRRFLERDRKRSASGWRDVREGDEFVERKRGAYLVLNLHNNSGYAFAPC